MGDFDPRALSALLAPAGFAALVLVPELKYPANPPAIGAASTIGARTALVFRHARDFLPRHDPRRDARPASHGWLGAWNGDLAAAAIFAVVAGIAAMALPPVDEVPAGFPAKVLWNFRLASIGARAVLWGMLGLAFGGMTQKWLRALRSHIRLNLLSKIEVNRMPREPIASVGTHFLIGLRPSPVLDAYDRALLADLRPAGVILFKSNFRHDLPYEAWLESHARLIADIRAAAGREQMLIAIDTRAAACAGRRRRSRVSPMQRDGRGVQPKSATRWVASSPRSA